MTRPRVLLADDHVMIAEGLKRLLADEFDLVGVVEDGRSLVETARRLRPPRASIRRPFTAATRPDTVNGSSRSTAATKLFKQKPLNPTPALSRAHA